MKRAKRYIINALILSGCTLLMRTVGVAFNAYCVNRIGNEGMGLYSLVMSVYTFAVTFATSGVNLATTRLVALYLGRGEGKSIKSTMKKCLLYGSAFGLSASLIMFFFAGFAAENILFEPRAEMSLRALSLSLLPLSLCSALSGYFAAVRRAYKNAISQATEQGIMIVVSIILLTAIAPMGVEYACLALILGGAASEIFSLAIQFAVYMQDKRGLTGGGKTVKMGEVVKISMPVALSAYVRSGLVTVEHILIPIGLAAYGEANALATYGEISAVALPIVLYPAAFVGAFAGLMIPEVTELDAAKNRREVAYVTVRAYSATLFCSMLAAGFICTFSSDICKAVYGSTSAAEYLHALAPLMPIMFLDTVTDSILKGLGKQFYTMCVNIADAGISVLLVWLLVPKMGIYGYIAVLYISECVNTLFSIGKLLYEVRPKTNVTRWVVLPLAAAVGASNLSYLIMSRLGLALSGTVAALELAVYSVCYLVLAKALGAVGKEELFWLGNIFAKGEKKTV